MTTGNLCAGLCWKNFSGLVATTRFTQASTSLLSELSVTRSYCNMPLPAARRTLFAIPSTPGLWQPGAPKNSIETFAWDEFNKHYMRALCRIAQYSPQHALIVLHARQSRSHRGSSDARINQPRSPATFLQQLRVQPAINPFGANSGLTLTLHKIANDSRQVGAQ